MNCPEGWADFGNELSCRVGEMNFPVGWADFELVCYFRNSTSMQVQTDDFSKNSTYGPKKFKFKLKAFLDFIFKTA